jgi:hypothetical protein
VGGYEEHGEATEDVEGAFGKEGVADEGAWGGEVKFYEWGEGGAGSVGWGWHFCDRRTKCVKGEEYWKIITATKAINCYSALQLAIFVATS